MMDAGAGGVPAPIYDWDDQISWEDSERFEEDSLCSWLSEPESLCQNWRGWSARAPTTSTNLPPALSYTGGISSAASASRNHFGTGGGVKILSLVDLAAKSVAQWKSFEEVEQFSFLKLGTSAPEALQLRIAFWCFPTSEDDVRLYSCLANGNADEFQRGENLYKTKAVKELLQIGFHLSAIVSCPPVLVNSRGSTGSGQTYSVAVTVDRCRITSCVCTCNPTVSWCSHVVAVCLHRIFQPDSVRFRAPVSESLNHLKEQQLRKFAQYLISELPRQVLPTAQRLLDELLAPNSNLNLLDGAPDPTAGASKDEVANWCLDDQTLHENIRKILIKFCVPSPTVFSDVNYLSSSLPPAANEWQSLLRPLRGREPEGLWNLLSIVREMYRRHDDNATSLLHIITEQCLFSDQVMRWWYHTKLSQSGNWGFVNGIGSSSKPGLTSTQYSSQYSCASLCDEIVALWRLATLNPRLRNEERNQFVDQLRSYHLRVVEKIWRLLNSGNSGQTEAGSSRAPSAAGFGKVSVMNARFDLDSFPGFRSALQTCFLEWDNCSDHQISKGHLTVTCCSENGPTHNSYSPTLPVIRERHSKKSPISSSSTETLTASYKQGKVWKAAEENADSSGESGQGSDCHSCTELHTTRLAIRELTTELKDNLRMSTPSPDIQEEECVDEVARLYMYDPTASIQDENKINESENRKRSPVEEVEEALNRIRPISDPLEVKFARCEALHAHGYAAEACKLAVALAEELMSHPPDLMAEIPPPIHAPPLPTPTKSGGKRKKKSVEISVLVHPKAMEISQVACATLEKAIFLFQVLLRENIYHQLAFRIGLFTLELTRQPAATKFLEVKMNHLETEIVALLKRIELTSDEMHLLRERAQRLRCGFYAAKGAPVLPFSLAHYIFESLCWSNGQSATIRHRLIGDESLGFEAAIAALSLKNTVSEAEHPLLCEGLRRQRCELALVLLLQYKDNHEKLGLVMDRLLEKDMHQMYKHHKGNAAFYGQQFKHGSSVQSSSHAISRSKGKDGPLTVGSSMTTCSQTTYITNLAVQNSVLLRSLSGISQHSIGEDELLSNGRYPQDTDLSHLPNVLDECSLHSENRNGGSPVIGSLEEEMEGESNFLSRDPSPPFQGPSDAASDSSSSGVSRVAGAQRISNNTDSVELTRSLNTNASVITSTASGSVLCTNTAGGSKAVDLLQRPTCLKSRHRRYVTPCLPNQPSEAEAHFMTELAKRLLTEAGGSHSTAIFNAPQTGAQQNQENASGPHRALHLCAFQIGLYALGLHNKVTPNWLSRTYSSHVSWISGQAMEIGRSAIRILIDTWENHLTPTEVANLADKASQGREAGMVSAAAELALSALPHAHALNPNEIQRALVQCRDQNTAMLEKACQCVEQAAKDGGVYPEVLFMVARQWNGLYNERTTSSDVQINGQDNIVAVGEAEVSAPRTSNVVAVPDIPEHQRLPVVRLPYQIPQDPCQHHQVPVLPPPSLNQAAGMVAASPSFPAQHHPFPPVLPSFPPVSVPAFVPHPATAAVYHQLALSAAVAGGYGLAQPLPASQPSAMFLHGQPPSNLTAQRFRPAGSVYISAPLNPAAAQLGGMPINFYGGFIRPLHLSHSAPNLTGSHQARHHHHHHGGPAEVDPHRTVADANMRYLYAAYRVGMLAMETMGRRIHDERSYIKYSQNPPYGDDVRWLFGISKKLGLFYAQQFCLVAAQSVVSPFVLWDLAVEAAGLFAPHTHAQPPASNGTVASCPTSCGSGFRQLGVGAVASNSHLAKHLLLPPVQPLVQRCFQMFYAAAHQKLSHPRFQPQDGEEVCNLVRAARNAFHQTPGGNVQFSEFLQSLRRQKACKKELWNKLMNTLSGS